MEKQKKKKWSQRDTSLVVRTSHQGCVCLGAFVVLFQQQEVRKRKAAWGGRSTRVDFEVQSWCNPTQLRDTGVFGYATGKIRSPMVFMNKYEMYVEG